jgi:hypothetical protein
MAITLTVPADIEDTVREEARRRGVPEEQLILDGLRMRFIDIDPDLQAEFDQLERASDEDFAKWVRDNECD